MGFIKNAKADSIAKEASKAMESGRSVFTPLLNMPSSNAGLSGAIDDWAAMIDSIEAAGWRLDQWSVGLDAKGRPQAFPLFRR